MAVFTMCNSVGWFNCLTYNLQWRQTGNGKFTLYSIDGADAFYYEENISVKFSSMPNLDPRLVLSSCRVWRLYLRTANMKICIP